jgi:hypothetical protein
MKLIHLLIREWRFFRLRRACKRWVEKTAGTRWKKTSFSGVFPPGWKHSGWKSWNGGDVP